MLFENSSTPATIFIRNLYPFLHYWENGPSPLCSCRLVKFLFIILSVNQILLILCHHFLIYRGTLVVNTAHVWHAEENHSLKILRCHWHTRHDDNFLGPSLMYENCSVNSYIQIRSVIVGKIADIVRTYITAEDISSFFCVVD